MTGKTQMWQVLDRKLGDFSALTVSLPAYVMASCMAWWAAGLVSTGMPILAVLVAMVASTLLLYCVSVFIGNASVYDPYWSVAPPLVALYLLSSQNTPSPPPERAWIVFAVVTLWSVRLTINCMTRWRRLAEEDFRYRDLRTKSGRWFWVVNLFGIELFPTFLVFLGCLPLFAAMTSAVPLNWLDLAGLLLGLAAIVIEAAADHQLRRHRTDPARTGILTGGIWGWSQHPNYLGEIAFWWALLLFGLAAGAPPWIAAGALAMTALFRWVSIPLMLARKRQRHTGYDAEVRGIPVLVPTPASVAGRRT